MNIAAGNPVERGKYLNQLNTKEYLSKIMGDQFNGYICVATHGQRGLEEGTIVLHNGNVVSSNYDYYNFNKNYKAEEALERALNSLLAKNGVVDLYSLTSYQVQLVLTLNEENNLKEKVSKKDLKFPNSFDINFEKELIIEKGEEVSKVDLLKKFGLTRSAAEHSTRTQLLNKAAAENEQIERTIKKATPKPKPKVSEGDRFSSLSKILKKK